MPSTVTSNDVSAITPEIWSRALQVPLYKSLVSLEVANTDLRNELTFGDTIHKQYLGDMSAATYTPGTPVTAQDLNYVSDTLTVSAYRTVTWYIDNVEQLQANVEMARNTTTEAAYRLRDVIDQAVFGKVNLGTDVGADLIGGTVNRSLSASSANVINMFSGARRFLRDANVEEAGDWLAVLTPKLASYIENKATSVGYNVADATLRNGYMGDFMGFHIYISNNLQTASIHDVTAETANVRNVFIGKRGTIDLVLQKAPSIVIKDVSDKLGKNFIASTVYGTQVFTKNASRFLNVEVHPSYD